MLDNINILSIAPYSILPAKSGGKITMRELHHHIGKICTDNVVSTADNEDNTAYRFILQKVFSPSKLRYLPYTGLKKLYKICIERNVRFIHSEHHYMGFTAMALARKVGVPWFIRSHNIEAERFRSIGKIWWPLMRLFEKYIMRKANGIFFITQEDADWAKQHYGIQAEKCHFIPHGTHLTSIPATNTNSKTHIAEENDIPTDVPWLYFLGALDYEPNRQAVEYMLNDILPRLDAKGFRYRLLIAGKGLNDDLAKRINAAEQVHYLGFVSDLDNFIGACDIMLNPVMTGGGIKTKAVEALGYNKIVVSSQIGAAGLLPEVCEDNLHITPNYDWDAFADRIIAVANKQTIIPQAFYDTYNWDKIAAKVLAIMQATKV